MAARMRTSPLVALACLPLFACLAEGSDVSSRDVESGGDALTVCASHTVSGVDVSEYQGSVHWSRVKAAGKDFAFIRASDGTGHVDPTFHDNWSGAKSAGVIRGAYQFFRASEDGGAQADLLISQMGKLADGDLPPVADVEVSDGVSASRMNDELAKWVAKIESATGKTPIIYTSPGLWPSLSGSSHFTGETMWVADWGPSCPSLPSPWTKWKFWQYADDGSVDGISGHVDLDRFDGTLSDLTSWAGAGSSGGGKKSKAGGSHQVGRDDDGRLEVFALSSNGHLQHTWQKTVGGSWHGWADLGDAGGGLVGRPDANADEVGRLEVAALGADGKLYHVWQNTPNGSWYDVTKFDGQSGVHLADSPRMGRDADGRLEVFAPGTDGDVYHAWQTTPNGSWSDFASLGKPGGGASTQIAVSNDDDGRLEVFSCADDGALWHAWQNTPNGSWADLAKLGTPGGGCVGAPDVMQNADGRLEVFSIASDGAVWYAAQKKPNSSWDALAKLGNPSGGFAGDGVSVAANADGRIEVYAIGSDGDLWHAWQNDASKDDWADFADLGGGHTAFVGVPSALQNADGRLEAFDTATSGEVWHVWQKSPNSTWKDEASLGSP